MAATLGINTKLGLAVSNPGSPPADPTTIYEYDSADLGLEERRIQTTGLRGRVDLAGHRELIQQRMVTGGFTSTPTALELQGLLPWILGTDVSGTTYALAETLKYRDIWHYKAAKLFAYRECVVTRATFTASQGQPLQLRVEVTGKARDAIGDYAWPALVVIDIDDVPWTCSDSVLTLAGTAYPFREASLTVENRYDPNRFLNTTAPTDFPLDTREITLTVNQPFGDVTGLLATIAAADVAGTLVFTTGVKVLTFTMGYLVAPVLRDPGVEGRGEVMFPYTLAARSDSNAGTYVAPLITQLSVA